MRISVITPSYNQGIFIRDTIESVLNQDYYDFEHIVVDGGSTDGTQEILKEYSHLIWISEKDSGPANAINKGFKMASGDIFSWINADDFYEVNIFNDINRIFESNNDIHFVHGNLTIVGKNGEIIYKDRSKGPLEFRKLTRISIDIRQPSTFFTKNIFNLVNGLDESLSVVFDYDLFVKMLSKTNAFFLDKNLSYYRDYDETLTRKNVRKQAVELFKVTRRNGARYTDRIMKSILRKFITGKL